MAFTPQTPLRQFLASFAWLIGALGRCVAERREQDQYSESSYAAVLARIDLLFARVQRAVYAFERGGAKRTVSAAFLNSRRNAVAPRRRAPALSRGFGWLVRWVPEAEGLYPRLAELLNDPALADVLRMAPTARRSLLSLCNMLGLTPYRMVDAQVSVLGHFSTTAGWFAEPPARRKDAGSKRHNSPPRRPKNE